MPLLPFLYTFRVDLVMLTKPSFNPVLGEYPLKFHIFYTYKLEENIAKANDNFRPTFPQCTSKSARIHKSEKALCIFFIQIID